MKNVFLLALSVFLLHLSTYAQSKSDKHTSKTAGVTVTLAGVTGPAIRIQQIKNQPIAAIAEGKEQVASFDFAWIIRKESGANEYIGPFHSDSNRLSDIALMNILKDAERGIVTRVYIEGVHLQNANGAPTKTEWGASYQVLE